MWVQVLLPPRGCSELLLPYPLNMQITCVTPACWGWGTSGTIALEKTVTGHRRGHRSPSLNWAEFQWLLMLLQSRVGSLLLWEEEECGIRVKSYFWSDLSGSANSFLCDLRLNVPPVNQIILLCGLRALPTFVPLVCLIILPLTPPPWTSSTWLTLHSNLYSTVNLAAKERQGYEIHLLPRKAGREPRRGLQRVG